MSSRDEILARARQSAAKVDEFVATPDPAVHIKRAHEDMVEDFVSKLVDAHAYVVQCEKDKVVDEIDKIIQKEGVSNLIYGPLGKEFAQDVTIENKFEFKEAIETFKDKLFDYDVGVVKARGGVSSHGLVCVPSSPDQPRLLSLTPKVLIALVDKETIVDTLSDQLNKIKNEDGRLPTNVNLIAGPSKTADIELITVIGVHGSQVFYVIVY